MKPTLGLNDFYLQHNVDPTLGNSYTVIDPSELVRLVLNHWDERRPGDGEGDRTDRKVLVPLCEIADAEGDALFYCPARVRLEPGMKVEAEVVVRQEGEDPYVETFVTPEEARKFGFIPHPATSVDVVCYSADALLENGGSRSTDKEWEIVTLICSNAVTNCMSPLTMARNFLEKKGGTKSVYTAKEFAEAIYESKTRGIKVRRHRS